MSQLFHLVSWPMSGVALLVFGFAPGALLRLIVLAFPKADPRRRELLGELHAVPRAERPFWVAEQLEVALVEGIGHRLVRLLASRDSDPQRVMTRLGVQGVPLPGAPLIGRGMELAELRRAFRRVTKSGELQLVTVLGLPGVGKSRLVAEFVGSLAPDDVIVLTGQCAAYGRGISYQPLAGMLGALDGGWAEYAGSMGSGGAEARRAADCLSGVVHGDLGRPADLAGIQEISWAVRYLLAQLGKAKPVIMVWEDLHWAESTLLDMIDGVVAWLTGVPVLLICVSRSDLRDIRPDWGLGKSSAVALELGPLSYEQSAELVTQFAARGNVGVYRQDVICKQVARGCEGNPLFAELMLDVVVGTEPGTTLSPAISAVLTAWFDLMPDDERQLLEIASVIGRNFSWAALRAMLTAHGVGDGRAQDIRARLVGRRIISRISGDDFRFDQILLRDTAYQLTPKSERERLHLLLADWLAQLADADGSTWSPGDAVALAYHVETAIQLRRELRPGDAGLPRQAARAVGILIDEGMKALRRTDFPGAAALLGRARGLMAPGDERQLPLMLYISDCWWRLSDPGQAIAALDPDSDVDRQRGELMRAIVQSTIELRAGLASPQEVRARAGQFAAEMRGRGDDDLAWCRFHQLTAYLHVEAERFTKAEAEFALALDRARAAQDRYEEDRMLGAICELAPWSPAPVSTGLKLCAEMSERYAANGAVLVPVLLTQARLAGLGGDLNGAKAALAATKAHLSYLHLDIAEAVVLGVTALIDSLAGDHRTAEMRYRNCQGLLLEMGRPRDAAAYEAYAARELFEQGKIHETQVALGRLSAKAHVVDLGTKVMVDALSARIWAVSGRLEQALGLAASAAELSEQTDDLCLQGNCYADLAIVTAQAGQQAASADATAVALDRYRAKGADKLSVRLQRPSGHCAKPAEPFSTIYGSSDV